MDRQEAALQQWLADHPDYTLVEALVDAGVSAGKGRHRKRGALARFIQGGRAKTIPEGSVLVVESLSRFSREAATSTLRTLLSDIWGNGLAVAFCAYGGDVLTSELIDAEPHRLHGILGGIQQARAEWEERSRRSKGACAKRRQLQDKGLTTRGRIPWWMTRDADGSIVLDPINAATVRRLVELAIAGNGQNILARTVQDEGRPNPKGGKVWTPEQARNTVDHTALSGDLQRRDRLLPGYYPAVITKDQHSELKAALAVMAEKYAHTGKRVEGKSLFQGMAFCHYCGGPIGRQRPNPKGRADHPGYARCSRAARRLKDADGNICPGGSKSIYLDAWEAHCLTRLSNAVWVDLLREPDTDGRISALTQQERDLRQAADRDAGQLARLEQRAEDLWASGGDEELLGTATRAVRKAREKAMASQAAADEAAKELALLLALPQPDHLAQELRDRIRAFVKGLPTATPDDRVEFNRWLVSRRPVVRFELDVRAMRVGLQVGDGEIAWEPLGAVDRAAVSRGMAGTERFDVTLEPELGAKLAALADSDGVIDLSPVLAAELGEGDAVAVEG